ncbi:MAG: P-loop NTPase [Nitrospinaceae bacterium]
MVASEHIIAVGGGKGGIGKSIVCTNLAIGLALSGKKVVLVDTDFGASNLHALLGIGNPARGFHDYFQQNGLAPQSLLLDTEIGNLKFISGAGDSPGSANIDRQHVQTIVDFIRGLEADHVFLDLGPGTHYNVIDFFNIGNRGIVLTTPEITSVLKSFSFIRATLFRRIALEFSDRPELKRLVDHSRPTEADVEIYSVDRLKEKLEAIDPGHCATVDSVVNSFKPGLIVNRVRNKNDLRVGEYLIKLVGKYLDVDLHYLGYLIESDRVRDSVDEMIPFLIKEPESKPSINLQAIIGTLAGQDIHLVKRDGKIYIARQVPLTSGWNV